MTIRILTLLFVASLWGQEKDPLTHAAVATYAVKSSTGEVIAETNKDLSLVPASCMKLLTTAAALHILGAESRFETGLEYDGVIDENQVLHGNLYIKGGGDPCLGSDRIKGSLSWDRQIEAWATAVEALGIREIEGNVIGDATLWEKALAVPSWSWEDLGNYYGAGASALSFHENAYELVLKPGHAIGAATTLLRTHPPLPEMNFQNEVTTSVAESRETAFIYGSEFSSLRFIRGTIPLSSQEVTIKGSISDPPAYCAHLLEKALENRGVKIQKNPLSKCRLRTRFHTTVSPTVGEIVYWTNQKSMNLYAEHLLKKIGEVVSQEGSTAAGTQAVTQFWKSRGIDLEGFQMVDGSGLSRKNLITAKQLVEILLWMKTSSFFSVFFDSLPSKKLLVSIRGKSGSMSLVRGYAGYADDIAFSILVNQCPDPKAMNERIDQFLAKISLGVF